MQREKNRCEHRHPCARQGAYTGADLTETNSNRPSFACARAFQRSPQILPESHFRPLEVIEYLDDRPRSRPRPPQSRFVRKPGRDIERSASDNAELVNCRR